MPVRHFGWSPPAQLSPRAGHPTPRAQTHADGPRTWLDLPCPAPHRQLRPDLDLPGTRIPASASVGADHEPDNALTRHSNQSMSSPRIYLSPGRPVVARMPGRRRSRAVAESSVASGRQRRIGYRSAPFGAAVSTTAQSRATSVAAGGGSISFVIRALRLSPDCPAWSSSWALDRPGRRSACAPRSGLRMGAPGGRPDRLRVMR